jgi:enoyl-CoA hydratase/carnithine racemase
MTSEPLPVVLTERRDGVLIVTLNRPDKLNALNRQMLGLLSDAFETAQGPEVRAVLLAGTGRAFSAGADVKEMAAMAAGEPVPHGRPGITLGSVLAMIPALPKPVVAAVGGVAVGGGFGLALACDLVVASREATFGLPEIRIGRAPGGLIPYLARHVGAKVAFDLAATGRTIDAAEALGYGMISRMVPPEKVIDEALTVASLLAGYASDAMAEIKALIGAPAAHG